MRSARSGGIAAPCDRAGANAPAGAHAPAAAAAPTRLPGSLLLERGHHLAGELVDLGVGLRPSLRAGGRRAIMRRHPTTSANRRRSGVRRRRRTSSAPVSSSAFSMEAISAWRLIDSARCWASEIRRCRAPMDSVRCWVSDARRWRAVAASECCCPAVCNTLPCRRGRSLSGDPTPAAAGSSCSCRHEEVPYASAAWRPLPLLCPRSRGVLVAAPSPPASPPCCSLMTAVSACGAGTARRAASRSPPPLSQLTTHTGQKNGQGHHWGTHLPTAASVHGALVPLPAALPPLLPLFFLL